MSEAEAAYESREQARSSFEDAAVAAERAFAIRIAYDGIRTAFLSVLAEDSVICGDGPEPGRSVYEALPKDQPGRLTWEPVMVAASSDGSLAFTTGPYRLLDHAGLEKSTGVYFSVWRRHRESGHLELVLDFGAKGAAFPDAGPGLHRLSGDRKFEAGVGLLLQECLETARIPSTEGAIVVGTPLDEGHRTPSGCFLSEDDELGVLWGAWNPANAARGAFAILLTASSGGPRALAAVHAR